jgi:hypothetical protein
MSDGPTAHDHESEPRSSAMQDAFADLEPGGADTVLRAVPDLRGMQVEDASGLSAGVLWGALAEADTGLLRYLDLALHTLNRHVLVPIGHARVHARDERGTCFRLRAALLEQLEQVPPFPAEVAHIDDPFERALLEAYGRTFHGERYYAHPAYDHSGLYAGEHTVLGDDGGPDDPLMRLSYLPGWRVAPGDPDIRSWPLVLADEDSRRIRDLIVDTRARKVRYAVVAGPDDTSARLLPVGYLQVDTDRRVVNAAGLTADDLAVLPRYDGGGVTREQEDRLAAALRRALDGSRRYLLPDFRHATHTAET